MPITNEQAMKELREAWNRAANSWFFHGLFLGKASAYRNAEVITPEQHKQLTEPVRAPA